MFRNYTTIKGIADPDVDLSPIMCYKMRTRIVTNLTVEAFKPTFVASTIFIEFCYVEFNLIQKSFHLEGDFSSN